MFQIFFFVCKYPNFNAKFKVKNQKSEYFVKVHHIPGRNDKLTKRNMIQPIGIESEDYRKNSFDLLSVYKVCGKLQVTSSNLGT